MEDVEFEERQKAIDGFKKCLRDAIQTYHVEIEALDQYDGQDEYSKF